MIHRYLSVLLAVVLLAGTLHAQWLADQATHGPNDTWAPALASSPDGVTVLVYGTAGDPLLMDFVKAMSFATRSSDAIVWPEPTTLTSGSSAVVCWSRTGFYAAINSGGMVVIRHADDGGTWDPMDEVLLQPYGNVTGMDIWGVPSDAAGPDVYLVIETWPNPPSGERYVQFASHNAFGWSAFETVVSGLVDPPMPQITWSTGPAGPWPTIFYLDGTSGGSFLTSVTKDLAVGWMAPVTVPAPCPVEGEFDIVTAGDLGRHVLGLGPQPTCPCGSVHYKEYAPGSGWLPDVNMTSYTAEFDWPMSPRIAAGPDGRIHAFWYQESRAADFTPLRRTLEYRVRDGGVWTDEGDFLDDATSHGSASSKVAIAVDPSPFPVLAWTQRDTVGGVPQPEQVWVARLFDTTPVPDEPIPDRGVALSAWPNPFNPSVTIAFESKEARSAQLDVYDSRGRHVARLLDRVVGVGRTEVAWDGIDDTGQSLPSGVYFAHIVSGGKRSVLKLVLAE